MKVYQKLILQAKNCTLGPSFLFFFISFGVSVAAIASQANSLNRLIGYTKSDFTTFAALLRDQVAFKDTISLKIANLAVKAPYIPFIAKKDFGLENIFLINYFLQNFLMVLAVLTIAWTLSRNVIISLIALYNASCYGGNIFQLSE